MKKKSVNDYSLSDKPVERAPAVPRDEQEMDYQMTPLSVEGEFIPKSEEIAINEAGMRLIIDTTPDAVIILDSQGTILFANGAAEILFGLKSEDLLGTDFGYPVVAEKTEELEVPARDGSLKTAEMRTVDITWEAKKALLISFRDITDRKRAEETLRKSESLLQKIFDLLPIGLWIADKDGKLLRGNPVGIKIWGAEPKVGPTEYGVFKARRLPSREEIAPGDWALAHTIRERVTVVDEMLEIDAFDGKKKVILNYTSPVLDNDGAIQSAIVVNLDITERKQTGEALVASETRYRRLFESAKDGILILDADTGKVLDANPFLLNLLGQSYDVLCGKYIWEIGAFKDIYASKEAFKILQDNEYIRYDDLPLKSFDGKSIPVEFVSNVYLVDNNKVVQCNIRDISERKRTDMELQTSLEKLRKALGGIIQAMVLTMEIRDPYTAGHQRRVSELARSIGQEMGLSEDQRDGLRLAGIVHDLGKIAVPAEILSKPTKLSNLEFGLIKVHPQVSHDILKDIDFPWPLAEIVFQHHERLDGSGYPRGLKGDEILVEAQILMVADVVEAIASHRPYRPALGIEVALEEIEKNKGILYDKTVADACLNLFREKGFQLEMVRF